MEGRVIGQYRVTGVLGKGGMGVVYAAEHTLLDRPAAVKVLLPKFSGDQEIMTRFFNEARAATAIRHPGIVEVYEIGWTDDGSAYIVMEHLQGETLRARRRRGPMRWSTALALVRQIAGALGAAHAKGIVHRDLKPANIFLVPDPEVPGGERIKLLDFGIAKLAGSSSKPHKTRTGTVIGTPAYMAPEQCRGVAVDARADLYALGCLLFELCTGRQPFVCEGEGDVLVAHIQAPPPTIASLVSGVPQEIEALVQRMLAKAPADRVQTADEVIRLIDAARTAISQVAKNGPQPVLTPEMSLPEVPKSAEPQETGDESISTHRTRRPPVPPPSDVGPSLVIEVEDQNAATPATQVKRIASRPDTTLSSAAGTRPRPANHARTRWSAVLGGLGALAILVAIAFTVVHVTRGGVDEALLPGAASPPDAGPAPTVPRPTPEVTPIESTPSTPQPNAPLDAADSPASEPTPQPIVAEPSTPKEVSQAPSGAPGHRRNPAPPRPVPATVQIRIESKPPGATVMVDGKILGVTPWVGLVAHGHRRVTFQLQRSGYETRLLWITPDKEQSHNPALVKLPQSTSSAPSPSTQQSSTSTVPPTQQQPTPTPQQSTPTPQQSTPSTSKPPPPPTSSTQRQSTAPPARPSLTPASSPAAEPSPKAAPPSPPPQPSPARRGLSPYKKK